MDAVGSDPMVSVVTITSNMHPSESKLIAPDSIGEVCINAPESKDVSDNTRFEKMDKVDHVRIDSNNSLVIIMDDNSEETVPVHQFSLENFEMVGTVFNINRIADVAYLLRKIRDYHK